MSWPRVVFNLFSVHFTALEGSEREKRMETAHDQLAQWWGWWNGGRGWVIVREQWKPVSPRLKTACEEV